jgi:hypothetical protein
MTATDITVGVPVASVAIEPRTPDERLQAARICRANSGLDAKTGERLERDAAQRQWNQLRDDVPYAVWIWMWRHARNEWDHSGPVGKLT